MVSRQFANIVLLITEESSACTGSNKEAKTLTARKIINVDHYQFSVERSMKQRAKAVPVFAREASLREHSHATLLLKQCRMVKRKWWDINRAKLCLLRGEGAGLRAGEEARSYVFILFAERASPVWPLFDDANLSRRLIKRAPSSLIRRCSSLQGVCRRTPTGPPRPPRLSHRRLPKPVNSTNYHKLSPLQPRVFIGILVLMVP